MACQGDRLLLSSAYTHTHTHARTHIQIMHGNFLHAAQCSYLHCTVTGDSDSDL